MDEKLLIESSPDAYRIFKFAEGLLMMENNGLSSGRSALEICKFIDERFGA